MSSGNRPTIPVPPTIEVTTSDEGAICRVCSGKVLIEYQNVELFGSTRIKTAISSIHCEDCGVIYKFPPPPPK